MGAVQLFEGKIKDQSGQSKDIHIEIGESNLDVGNKLGCVYFKINGEPFFMDDETGKKVVQAFCDAGSRINYI
jgi:hypothetical protein